MNLYVGTYVLLLRGFFHNCDIAVFKAIIIQTKFEIVAKTNTFSVQPKKNKIM